MLLSDLFCRENNNLDLIRLLLAIVVIIGHVPAFKTVSPNYVDFVTILFPFTYSGAMAVKIFFFISGLLVTNSLLTRNNFKTYIVSRALRIYPALIFASVIIVLICYFMTTAGPAEYWQSAARYLKKVVTMKFQYNLEGVSFLSETSSNGGQHAATINGSIWTISWEVSMYATLLAVYFIALSTNMSKLFLVVVFSFLSLSPLLISVPLLGGGTNEEASFLLAPFFAGSVLAVLKDRVNLNWQLVLGMFFIYCVLENDLIRHWISYIAVPLSLVWLSSLPFIRKIHLKRDISYGTYVWGWFVEVYVQYLFPTVSHVTYVIICLAIVLPIAIFSAIFVEEPSMKLAKKINSKIS